MELIVDLHVHSHYSRATSANMNLEGMYRWAKIKGINILGTGDFTHPLWFQETQTKLEPAEPGLFKLKDELAAAIDAELPASVQGNLLRFILSVEISNIYKRHNKVRKLHNLIIAPTFAAVAEFNTRLGMIGNLKSDGRPILGLDSEKLLQLCIDIDPGFLFIPAHIWTPWFALFGSRSGFDMLEEAFGELTPQIRAVETGLSSDPYMNWRIRDLDGLTLVSNSDAHSAQKLGREANILDCELNYAAITGAIKSGSSGFKGTIEFFPQEGRYHYDGHRACNVVLSPAETNKINGICPKCGKPLVVGVDNRVNFLADKKRPETFQPKKHKLVEYIIPLPEIIAELKGTKSTQSKAVQADYPKVIAALGNEFAILRTLPTEKISAAGFPQIAYAVKQLRAGAVYVQPGYDGVYGVIKIFAAGANIQEQLGQLQIL